MLNRIRKYRISTLGWLMILAIATGSFFDASVIGLLWSLLILSAILIVSIFMKELEKHFEEGTNLGGLDDEIFFERILEEDEHNW